MKRIYSLFFLLCTAAGASANETGCEYIFHNVNNVKIKNCDKENIKAMGVYHGEKIVLEGSVVIMESNAYTSYDLKINNNFIAPANTGRYITHIDNRYEIATKQGELQVIHSNEIFGDGQLDKNNTYYACLLPEFKKCLMLEVEGRMKKSVVNKILTKIAEMD